MNDRIQPMPVEIIVKKIEAAGQITSTVLPLMPLDWVWDHRNAAGYFEAVYEAITRVVEETEYADRGVSHDN